MNFDLYVPKHPLGLFIEHFICYSDYKVDHAIDRFLPDGNTEIVIDLFEKPQPIFDNETLKEIQLCKGCWASGVRTQPISIPSGNGSAMFIISFKKGMAAPFFPVPMHEVSDQVIQSEFLWREFFADLRNELLEQKTAQARFAVAESFLLSQFERKLNVNPCVDHAVRKIVDTPSIRMSDLTKEIGYSQRHFIGMFKGAVGVTPKTYLTVLRFQHAVQKLERARSFDSTQLALDCGYFDQSHFIHDFKRFSGFTPTEYVARKNGMLNYVPVG